MSKKLPSEYPYTTYLDQSDKLFQLYKLLCLERESETYPYNWLVIYGDSVKLFLDEKAATKSALNYNNSQVVQRHTLVDSLLSQGIQFTPHEAYYGYDFTIYPSHPTTPNERITIHYDWLANNREYFGWNMGHFIVGLSFEVANIIYLQSYGVVFSDKVIALAKRYAKELVNCNPYVMGSCVFEFAK